MFIGTPCIEIRKSEFFKNVLIFFILLRDDFSPKFVGLFVLLLFLKSFHWLAEERVDFMERSPVISILFHLRVSLNILTQGFNARKVISEVYASFVLQCTVSGR